MMNAWTDARARSDSKTLFFALIGAIAFGVTILTDNLLIFLAATVVFIASYIAMWRRINFVLLLRRTHAELPAVCDDAGLNLEQRRSTLDIFTKMMVKAGTVALCVIIAIPSLGVAADECLSGPRAVRSAHHGAYPVYSMRLEGHRGSKCWMATYDGPAGRVAQRVEHRASFSRLALVRSQSRSTIPTPRERPERRLTKIEAAKMVAEFDRNTSVSLREQFSDRLLAYGKRMLASENPR